MPDIDWNHTGWVAALFASMLAFAQRIIIGRYNAHAAVMKEIDERLNRIETDLAGIKGVLRERDRNGRHTWPQNHD